MKSTPNRRRDSNQLDELIVDLATGQAKEYYETAPAVSERGLRAGRRNGKVRARRMSAEARTEIGRMMATARWQKE